MDLEVIYLEMEIPIKGNFNKTFSCNVRENRKMGGIA
jgi:hypothetical protein